MVEVRVCALHEVGLIPVEGRRKGDRGSPPLFLPHLRGSKKMMSGRGEKGGASATESREKFTSQFGAAYRSMQAFKMD